MEVSDSGTGIDNDKIWYYISDTALTEGDVTALEDEKWSSYDNSNKPFITQGTHFVYVKATDESGNTAYVGTDGIVIYEDSTAVSTDIAYTYKGEMPENTTLCSPAIKPKIFSMRSLSNVLSPFFGCLVSTQRKE